MSGIFVGHCITTSEWINPGAYAGFLRGGPNFKIFGILDIHAAERHVASSEAASLC